VQNRTLRPEVKQMISYDALRVLRKASTPGLRCVIHPRCCCGARRSDSRGTQSGKGGENRGGLYIKFGVNESFIQIQYQSSHGKSIFAVDSNGVWKEDFCVAIFGSCMLDPDHI
jgi:hypothetical protein